MLEYMMNMERVMLKRVCLDVIGVCHQDAQGGHLL